MQYIDLSGYMFSGKAAVSDLLREFNGIHLPNNRSEFDLIRMAHGLSDLKSSLDNWSWTRSDSAIREFIRLAKILERTPSGISRLYQVGFCYGERYPGFLEASNKFINSITDAEWEIKWPYEVLTLSPWSVFLLKITSNLKKQHSWSSINYHLISGNNFIEAAKEYVSFLLSSGVDLNQYHSIVTHNALEPTNPAAGFCFFDNIKSIVVDRDVRDIYMTGSTYSKGFNDIVPLYSRIIGSFDIDIFIKRQKILRDKTNYNYNKNILRIKFEDLVLNYQNVVPNIYDFLDMESSSHVNKLKYFNPEDSKKNVGLWNTAEDIYSENIKKLEQELPDLCYQ